MEGVHRFLARSHRLVTGDTVTEAAPSKEQLRLLHNTIKRVHSLLFLVFERTPASAPVLPAHHDRFEWRKLALQL